MPYEAMTFVSVVGWGFIVSTKTAVCGATRAAGRLSGLFEEAWALAGSPGAEWELVNC